MLQGFRLGFELLFQYRLSPLGIKGVFILTADIKVHVELVLDRLGYIFIRSRVIIRNNHGADNYSL